MKPEQRYIVDEGGERLGVVLSLEDYQRMLEELEELESIRAYDAAKASGDEAIPLEQAVAEIEKGRLQIGAIRRDTRAQDCRDPG